MYASLNASTDLSPQETFNFLEMHAIVVSENRFGAFFCLRRPAGLPSDERSCRIEFSVRSIEVTA